MDNAAGSEAPPLAKTLLPSGAGVTTSTLQLPALSPPVPGGSTSLCESGLEAPSLIPSGDPLTRDWRFSWCGDSLAVTGWGHSHVESKQCFHPVNPLVSHPAVRDHLMIQGTSVGAAFVHPSAATAG